MNQLIKKSCTLIKSSTSSTRINYKLSRNNFNLSLYRMASSYLINDSKYSFLKDLGLSEQNQGVFAKHGSWRGNGEVVNSFSPANNRPIASVVQGNENDYEHCVEEAVNAWKTWADVRDFRFLVLNGNFIY